jgi:hypothetical protein
MPTEQTIRVTISADTGKYVFEIDHHQPQPLPVHGRFRTAVILFGSPRQDLPSHTRLTLAGTQDPK